MNRKAVPLFALFITLIEITAGAEAQDLDVELALRILHPADRVYPTNLWSAIVYSPRELMFSRWRPDLRRLRIKAAS